MGANSAIEWTDATWNPVKGCSRVSAGCDHCYAMRMARRQDVPGGAYEGLTRTGKNGVDWSGIVRLDEKVLDAPLRWRKPRRVFVNSMSDLFHPALSDEAIDRVFEVIAMTPRHTFQVLTKRPERMAAFVARWLGDGAGWKRNVIPTLWLGVSVEDQAAADARIPWLLRTPAAMRFLSCEPLLSCVDLTEWLGGDTWTRLGAHARRTGHAWGEWVTNAEAGCLECDEPWPAGGLDWLIAGGESGPGARPMHPAWMRSLRDQCQAAGVSLFVKQMGSAWAKAAHASDSKGGVMSDWPADLQVRDFPAATEAATWR